MNRSLPRLAPALFLLVAASCVPPEEAEEGVEGSQALAGACAHLTGGPDLDGPEGKGDGLPDAYEQCLLERHAPIYHLSNERYLPTNVDWFLARSQLKFRHTCTICDLDVDPRQENLVNPSASHNGATLPPPNPVRGGGGGSTCSHNGSKFNLLNRNINAANFYFLALDNQGYRTGSADASDWRVYGRVSRNAIGGANIQYWTFFAFSDGYGPDDHEGDWEMVTVQLRPDGSPEGLFMAGHGRMRRYGQRLVKWTASHPHVFVAKGTHASYPSARECYDAERAQEISILGFDKATPTPGCIDESQTQKWFSWTDAGGEGYWGGGVINVGEIGHPINGQIFIDSNVKWGANPSSLPKLGGSGPTGPTFGNPWNHDDDRPADPPLMGAGGSDNVCELTCDDQNKHVWLSTCSCEDVPEPVPPPR